MTDIHLGYSTFASPLLSPLPPAHAGQVLPKSQLPDKVFFGLFGEDAAPKHSIHLLADLLKAAPANVSASRPIISDQYVAMSALQKSVRLGVWNIACDASDYLIANGRLAANWKRLRTIAVEDVGLGDPAVATFVLWLAGRKDLHATLGDRPLSHLALQLLCASMKSRDMCDVSFWAALPGTIGPLMHDLGQADSHDLVAIASDAGKTFAFRHAAARALFPARFKGAHQWRRRSVDDRLALYDRLRMPQPVAMMIEADITFGGDVLTSAGPVVWASVSSSDRVGRSKDALDCGGLDLLGGLPASTYDRYTRLGHRVLRTMLRDHQPWMDFFKRHPKAQPLPCLLRALFYTEGGLLRPKLAYDRSSDLYWSILQAKFASTGITSMDDGGWELLDLTRDAMPKINILREKRLRG